MEGLEGELEETSNKRATLVGSFVRSVIHAPWEKQSHPAEPHKVNEDEHGIRGQDDHGGPGWEEEAMDKTPAGLSGTRVRDSSGHQRPRPWPLEETGGESTVSQPFS